MTGNHRRFSSMKRTIQAGLAVAWLVSVCGCGFKPKGVVTVRIPEEGLRSVTSVSLTGSGDKPVVWTATNLTTVLTNRMPAGVYQVRVGFANSNGQPPTEADFGRLTIAPKATNDLSLGLLTFSVREGLPDLNLSAITVTAQGGTPSVTLKNTGNTYYFFAPKPLRAGSYDVSILYSGATVPSAVATGIVVNAGEKATITLDTGVAMQVPRFGGNLVGWSLTPEGKNNPWVNVRRGSDNGEPLWRRFIIPPGTYRVALFREGTPPDNGPEDITIEAGTTLEYSSIQ
jgi:hypothetical protein